MQVLLGILIASFAEWFIHRFLLHGLGKNKNSIWHFHWKHHRAVRAEEGYDLLYFKYNQGYPKERLSLLLAFILISPLFLYYPTITYLFIILCTKKLTVTLGGLKNGFHGIMTTIWAKIKIKIGELSYQSMITSLVQGKNIFKEKKFAFGRPFCEGDFAALRLVMS